jgi:hypothetical protein
LKELKQWPKTEKTTEYPWDLYLNGDIWQVKKGVDFQCEVASMVRLICHNAEIRDLVVKTSADSKNETVTFQVTGPRKKSRKKA